MDDHPALDTIYWTVDERSLNHVEVAEYRGHKLRVRHFPDLQIGYVDGKSIGNADNMPKICIKLFMAVDAMESSKQQD